MHMGDESRFNSHLNDDSLNGTAMAPNGADYSIGRRELTTEGYDRYNIDDDDGIYIAKVPEKAFFNGGEPVIVKAQAGVFVGGSWQPAQTVQPKVVKHSSDPRSLFSNITRGNEHIIRTHVGTYDAGKVVEQRPLSDFVDAMNKRISSGATFQSESNPSLTSSEADELKVDMRSGEVNRDNLEVKPVENPKVQRKFCLVDGKFQLVEVPQDNVPSKPVSDSTVRD